MALFDRLLLSKDLALEGAAALTHSASDATAIRGIVLLDLSFDIATRAALDHLGITPADSRFPGLVSALPGFQPDAASILDFHRQRNVAQHAGVAPPRAARQQLRQDGERGLDVVFGLAGADYRTFSSVPQIESGHLREPLEHARSLASTSPADAIALVMQAFRRLRGWAEHVIGDAAIPDLMWVHADYPRWNDRRLMVACADNRDEFVDGMLKLAGATVLQMSVPDWIRLSNLGHGHEVVWESGVSSFAHTDNDPIAETDVAWAIEIVARSALALEREWPELLLVPTEAVVDSQS